MEALQNFIPAGSDQGVIRPSRSRCTRTRGSRTIDAVLQHLQYGPAKPQVPHHSKTGLNGRAHSSWPRPAVPDFLVGI